MATTVKQTIGEIDVVAFTEAIDKTNWSDATGAWPPGTKGTVVSDYGDHKEVEISDDRGVALDFPVVPVEKLELIAKYSGQVKVNPPIRAKRQRRKPQRATATRSSVA
jgi:hypothetical protein